MAVDDVDSSICYGPGSMQYACSYDLIIVIILPGGAIIYSNYCILYTYF